MSSCAADDGVREYHLSASIPLSITSGMKLRVETDRIFNPLRTAFVLLNVTTEPLGVYPGPLANATALQKCQCTDVGYNLYAACAACQVGDDNTHWLRSVHYAAFPSATPPIIH